MEIIMIHMEFCYWIQLCDSRNQSCHIGHMSRYQGTFFWHTCPYVSRSLSMFSYCKHLYSIRYNKLSYIPCYSLLHGNNTYLRFGLAVRTGLGTFNTLRPRQDGRHFPDDIFKCIFLNENIWISKNGSMKFVPKGRINNIPALVQIMAWRRSGDKPLSEPMMMKFTDAYMRHSASLN